MKILFMGAGGMLGKRTNLEGTAYTLRYILRIWGKPLKKNHRPPVLTGAGQ